jgi:hypothetical protein
MNCSFLLRLLGTKQEARKIFIEKPNHHPETRLKTERNQFKVIVVQEKLMLLKNPNSVH